MLDHKDFKEMTRKERDSLFWRTLFGEDGENGLRGDLKELKEKYLKLNNDIGALKAKKFMRKGILLFSLIFFIIISLIMEGEFKLNIAIEILKLLKGVFQ